VDDEPLIDLVDARRIDELFERVTVEDAADAWWRYALAPDDERSEQSYEHSEWWTVELWWESAFLRNEALVRATLLALIDRAPAGADLGYAGAGPLEDFINEDEDRLRWVEEQAERSEDFRRALSNVWWPPGPLFDRLEHAAGVRLAVPGTPVGDTVKEWRRKPSS
jgi:hypothetical protein